MARCPECGFTNEDDAVSCKKCGAGLNPGSTSSSQPQAPANKPSAGDGVKTVMGGGASSPAWDQSGASSGNSGGGDDRPSVGHKTVVGGSASMPAWDGPASGGASSPSKPAASTNSPSSIKCGSCGFYPLRAEPDTSNPCPNCGNTGSVAAAAAAPASGGNAGEDKFKAAPKGAAKTMMLSDLTPDEEEQPAFMLVDEKTQKSQDFEGEETTLSRENLDSNNMSISGGKHAVVTFKDGKWYLNDASSNGATFVQVQGELELKNNTKILLGNKIYTFKSE